MKVFIFLTVLAVTIFTPAKASYRSPAMGRAAAHSSASPSILSFCYNDVQSECRGQSHSVDARLENCNALYGKFGRIQSKLEQYANALIDTSFKYLTVSSYFGNFERNRMGLKRLYRKLSDEAWDDAKDLINFITLRGGEMHFDERPTYWNERRELQVNEHDLSELERMSNVLDNYKMMADEAIKIQREVTKHADLDGSVAHYFEERFFQRQTKTVHTLSGYVNDLKRFFSEADASLALFLFDEYLLKSV
ncbi:uncharacterized protein LOC124179303 [Neodiprion fabricii]|uniref:uncharacterized protein LOC124179303 n=1 Tax=Neodiprion fabricii TaxID=2872261 RepID=UPI001ED8EA84|nr:uncharacterized protein LOC124179303 [Neodiprion fabricii]XP_046419466.1 uncharacterized protein LOC124179303 [Neodiprion fabricii]